ncbi:hypothetical protein A2985_04220 [Candidatus Woesebacteria bacterium RIFCSPLOWO2_01_FULL_43_11]|uniref:RCK N-terminal domain-containing protein n=1 Tax=Candidatus Woesebacteria bacterium RBG_16_42_24 TaxID=1802485 RepID=A0A1F7XJX1_9BACT|nr:MAG: hypothetical protein A2V97_01805 [Candidatus Woesebacteria bacterium RBG_16_42_24]OGM67332.1 MAG: hypothetical protein A2985_04220 [Candidatus Woesebacteria bacterium RIFCSPLOWO2_01_FULL_43_11]
MDLTQIALLLACAGTLGVVARILKQPPLIGYLFAGLGLAAFGIIKDPIALADFGKIGVTLLLFLVGLEMNLKELPSLGKVAFSIGLGQIVFTSLIGFLIALALGFAPVPSIYIAVALTFSSTIIIVKLLSEKGDLGALYGKVTLGVLLVQDLVAILILMFLSGVGEGDISLMNFLVIGVKGAALLVSTWFLSKKILPEIFESVVGESTELLFILSIAWALGISALVGGPLGFSFEIGGFLAGLALSNLPEHLGVAAKTRPLRDFFLTIFFLFLGTQLFVGNIGQVAGEVVILSFFVLIGNPLIVLIIMGLMRFKKRSSFMAGVALAQISEFSFILMSVGKSMGHIGEAEVALVVVVGVVTMTASSYLILYADRLYPLFKNILSVFEREKTREEAFGREVEYSNHIVLVGCNRVGMTLLPFLKRKKILTLVVDHNPKIFNNLTADGVPVILGDIEDPEILSLAKMQTAQMVISSVPYLNDNLLLIEHIKSLSRKPTLIVKAQSRRDALRLYEKGANLVLIPEVITGEFLRHVFLAHGVSEERIKKMGKGHYKRLISSV